MTNGRISQAAAQILEIYRRNGLDPAESTDNATLLAVYYVTTVEDRLRRSVELGQPIDEAWLASIGGAYHKNEFGFSYFDFPIITESNDRTFLRIHEVDSDGDWSCDLFSKDGEGCAIVNWPATRGQFLALMSVLGIEPVV